MDQISHPINSTQESKRFVSLFLPIQRRLYAYINYHAPNKNDSEDIFQEVSATLLSKFSDYQEGTDFLKWAITIAKYKILSFRRDNKRMRILFDEEDMDRFQSEAHTKVELLEGDSEKLKKCLKKLSDKQTNLLEFRYRSDMTYRQIAKKLNVSMQSVYRSMSRIHVSLLQCIKMTSRLDGGYEQ